VSVAWRNANAITLDYALDDGQRRTIERRLDDPSWKKARPG
jgi:hypothetical protein